MHPRLPAEVPSHINTRSKNSPCAYGSVCDCLQALEDRVWFRHRRMSEPFRGREFAWLQCRRTRRFLSRRQAGSGQILAVTLSRGPRHQHCKDDRNQDERRHISQQMPALARILDGLNAHDRPMNRARPNGEPDEALVSIRMFEAMIRNTPSVAYTPMIIIR